ncbi:MAG TPA: glycosyltransferase family 4 protein [Anaerolineae bacterium]|nr:glycosyltransferase family 4 protein [Anaerolineae bacterium]
MQGYKVCFLSDTYPPDVGGLAVSAERNARLLAQAGHEVHVCVPSASLPPGEVQRTVENGVAVHRLGPRKKVHDTLTDWFELVTGLGRELSFDLLHGFFAAYAGYLAAYAARYLGARSVVSVRGNDLDRLVFDPARTPFILYALEQADAVTAVTRDLRRKVLALVDRQGVYHVPNSVDAELFHPGPPNLALCEKLGLDQGYVLGFVGEARAKKGLSLLLRAFAKVTTKVNAHLLLIGGLRPRAAEVYQLFRRRNPQLSLHLVPYVPQSELVDYYNLMDLVLMPSLRDGLPNVLLEAMACQRTVVASDVGGISDVIEDGQNGFLVPPRDKQALVECTLSALADANQRRALGRAARETILRDYTPRHELNNNLRIYHQLLAGASSLS